MTNDRETYGDGTDHETDDETDDELAERLGGLLARFDPVPDDVIAAAKASGAWRGVDAELAVLMHDSLLESNELAGVRGGANRLLTFASPDVTVELEIFGEGQRLIGQVGGTSAARVEICRPGGSVAVETDPVGHFSSQAVPPGPLSIRVVDDASGAVIQTEWVVV